MSSLLKERCSSLFTFLLICVCLLYVHMLVAVQVGLTIWKSVCQYLLRRDIGILCRGMSLLSAIHPTERLQMLTNRHALECSSQTGNNPISINRQKEKEPCFIHAIENFSAAKMKYAYMPQHVVWVKKALVRRLSSVYCVNLLN